MAKNTFRADSWLRMRKTLSSNESHSGPASKSQSNDQFSFKNKSFYPVKHLVPGWEGTGLISKSAVSIQNALLELWKSAGLHFKKLNRFTKSMKISVYNEFLSYIDSEYSSLQNKEMLLDGLENLNAFWLHLESAHSPHRKLIDQFLDIYCFKTVVIYVFKIRFIQKLCSGLGIPLNEDQLLSPSSCINKIFKKGSSTELFAQSVQINQYSWFRPSYNKKKDIYKLSQNLSNISITELMKICTHISKKESSLQFSNKEYSHSLSHLSFGKFINDLFIRLPQWLNKSEDRPPSPPKKLDDPEVFNCKFRGDYLSSISLAHWLAQDEALIDPWDTILCPDFIGENFATNDFNKIYHELQFITFLIDVAEKQNCHPIHLISNVMKKKSAYSVKDISEQLSIFNEQEDFSNTHYNQIFLGLIRLPKKNPHHFLTQQILLESKTLKRSGSIFVATNQNLFVPSHSERVEQLLEAIKLDVVFNLENIKGKGEVPNYIYIFSNKIQSRAKNFTLGHTPFNQRKKFTEKMSCLTFRWSGELKQFNHFSKFVDELRHFFHKKNSVTTAIFSKECSENLSFEFHQDAILEGKLLNSNNNNPNNITHPQFFKNLTKTCLTFDQFFYIDNLSGNTSTEHNKSITSGLLGITLKEEDKYPFVLIVDQTNIKNIQIELVQNESYQAKKEQYGSAFFQYFGLIPKISELNINLFRDFFQMNIGIQIIQLSLSGGFTKLKSKLKSLLVPRFFSYTTLMPPPCLLKFELLQLDEKILLQSHPQKIKESFDQIKKYNDQLIGQYPWQIMGIYSHFSKTIKRITFNLDREKKINTVSFKNPLLIESLINVSSIAIYPNNDDIYIEYMLSGPKDFHLELTKTKMIRKETDCLELWGHGQAIVRLHSDIDLLTFIDFILSSAIGHPISQILQSLSVPSLSHYKDIIKNYFAIKETFLDLADECQIILKNIITQQISAAANKIN